MNDSYFIGIDPGINGGLTCMNLAGTILKMTAMPIIKVGTKNKLDPKAIATWLGECFTEETVRIVALEEQRAMHKQGVTSTFSTGRGYGMLEGIISTLNLPYEIIRPVDWQREMFRGMAKDKTKALSIRVARQLYPNQDFKKTPRCTKLHDGLTDATLIAEYIRRKVK